MHIEDLKNIFRKKGANEFLYKKLADNDNVKQQIYLGGSYEAIQVLPYGEIYAEAGNKRPVFKAPIKLSWLSEDGRICPAPDAKLILYPKYPEIRLSGFVRRCTNAPKEYLQPKNSYNRTKTYDGRILILCPINDEIIAYLAIPGSEISSMLINNTYDGVFGREPIKEEDSKSILLEVLKETYKSNPHELVRMFSNGEIKPYNKRNAAGYTLEARFGIIPNGSPDPDFKGWELKCHSDNIVTLMTPQPNGGLYEKMGNRDFVNTYGHLAESGSMYFTGPYSCEPNPNRSGRRIIVTGYDFNKKKIVDTCGAILLIQDNLELASWSFSHILNHWNNKHNKTCYIRYKKHINCYLGTNNKIDFLPNILLCEGTSAINLIQAIIDNYVYYDPGCRVSCEGESKPRNQFRVKIDNIHRLYSKSEYYNLEDCGLSIN